MKHAPLAAFLSALLLHGAHAARADAEAKEELHVLLQGASAQELAQLVEDTGGTLTHSLHIIDAVGARMSRAQLERALESELVARHIDDLGEDDPPEEDDEPCRVRGHLELDFRGDQIAWPLYNKREQAARWKSLTISWPESLGRVTHLALGDQVVDQQLYRDQSGSSLEISFPTASAPLIEGREDLVIGFSAPQARSLLQALRQRDFELDASFVGDCSTDLVPGYDNNHEDFYYSTVSGAADLHLQGIRGQGVTVAVVDSGLWEHPALMHNTQGKPRVLARYDAITDTAGQEALDESGHGTHMTSIVAHSGPTLKNGQATGSFKGVAPDANIVAVKILDREGKAHLLDIVRGIQWVVDHREKYNIRVLNLSFAQLPRWHYWEDPVNQATMRAWAAGITVVAAAGNDGPELMTVGSPGNLPYVITVGAVTDSWTPDTRDDDYIPDFSSRGPTPAGHVKPDIVALGGHMTGLVHPDSDLAESAPEDILAGGEYASTGSSQAAALVSGFAALLLQLEPDLSPDDIKCKLITSAEPAINRDGLLAYSPFEQGYGYVTATRAVILGERGCGNTDLDIAADLAGERHFYGPAIIDEDDNPSLPGLAEMVASEPSAQGMSDTRRWGVKDHIERMDIGGQESAQAAQSAFDWEEMYLSEKAAIDNLLRQPGKPAAGPANTLPGEGQ
ncbi:MAG: alkaline serine protease [Halioglobus sp.]|nr:alkaline serine protease [Halioglobus sp.]